MRKTILTIRAGQCRYPTTDAPPHLFCSEPVMDDCTPYCEEHHFLCYAGFGKRTPEQLADMIYNAETTITMLNKPSRGPEGFKVRNADTDSTVPVDVVIGDDK